MSARASDFLEPVRTKVNKTLRHAQARMGESARAAGEATDRYAHENPWRLVAVTALAACMFGYLIGSLRE
jgi:ElaB/YqjD/DUF883 family membrane-anchored ribosome-binding protein